MNEICKKLKFLEKALISLYPQGSYTLDHKFDDYKMYVAIVLSSQTNDKITNKVLKTFFQHFPNLESILIADEKEIYQLIKSIPFAKRKAKYIKLGCKILYEKFNKKLPCDRKLLLQLPGIGDKAASYILVYKCNENTLVVDTHCYRVLTRYLGLTIKDAKKFRKYLENNCKNVNFNIISKCIVQFGRDICKARYPLCSKCPVNEKCEKAGL